MDFNVKSSRSEEWVACKNQSFKSLFFHSSIIFGAKIDISGTKWVEKTPIHTLFLNEGT
jgi:hypothetical protein